MQPVPLTTLYAFSGHHTQQDFKIIFRSRFVRFAVPAFETFMNDDPLAFAEFDRNRFHQSAAIRSTVTGTNINMLRIKTIGTMVGVSVSPDFPAAVLTNKIFSFANEGSGHQNSPIFASVSDESISSGSIQLIAGSDTLNQFACRRT